MDQRAQPLADEQLTKKIYNLIEKASTINKIKRGANEATKSLNRDISEIIFLAADAVPIEIILHLPLLCEDKSVPYIFLPSMNELGQVCGTSRNVIACSIIKNKNENNSLLKEINDLKVEIDKFFVKQIK